MALFTSRLTPFHISPHHRQSNLANNKHSNSELCRWLPAGSESSQSLTARLVNRTSWFPRMPCFTGSKSEEEGRVGHNSSILGQDLLPVYVPGWGHSTCFPCIEIRNLNRSHSPVRADLGSNFLRQCISLQAPQDSTSCLYHSVLTDFSILRYTCSFHQPRTWFLLSG